MKLRAFTSASVTKSLTFGKSVVSAYGVRSGALGIVGLFVKSL